MVSQEWESLLSNPEEKDYWLLRLAYADWMEEQGRGLEARAWRWVVRKERKPAPIHYPGGDGLVYNWFNPANVVRPTGCTNYRNAGRAGKGAILPLPVFMKIRKTEIMPYGRDVDEAYGQRSGLGVSFPSHRDAELDLIRVLTEVL